jgi:hypothetical protein
MISDTQEDVNKSVNLTLFTSRSTGMVPYVICQNVSPSAGLVWAYVEGWVHSKKQLSVFIAGGSTAISRDTGLSISTVKRCLSDLRKHNMIETKQGVQGSTYTLKHESEWRVNLTRMEGQIDTHERVTVDRIKYPCIPLYTPIEEKTATQSFLEEEEKTKAEDIRATPFPEEETRQEITARESSASVGDFELSKTSNTPTGTQSPAEDKSQSPTLVAGATRRAAHARPGSLAEAQARINEERKLYRKNNPEILFHAVEI